MAAAMASATSAVVHVSFPEATSGLLEALNQQRLRGQLCDVSIRVQGREFRAHRAVLAASSPYFHDQVLLKGMTSISLPGVMDPGAFETVLASAYTGRLSMAPADVVNLLTVGSVLQMWHIVDKCTELLRQGRAAGAAAARADDGQSPSSSSNNNNYSSPRHPGGDTPSGPEARAGTGGRAPAGGPPRAALRETPAAPPDGLDDDQDGDEDDDLVLTCDDDDDDSGHVPTPGAREDQVHVCEPSDGLAGCDAAPGGRRFRPAPVPPTTTIFPSPPAAEPGGPGIGGPAPAGDGAKVFLCHCGKAFSHKSMRDRHVNMHLNLRPFDCPVCAKKFKMKHHLTEHMKTHTGLKPYECPVCAKKFMWRDSFMRHRGHCERRHRPGPPGPSVPGPPGALARPAWSPPAPAAPHKAEPGFNGGGGS
ncbi:zinc finger and BTB domain-containing protein 22 [Tachyglossus aculeatus]|uniref:zinc finger and BTB domain-containing protein 22 n=1 Tax=Tachyglossus aculeatus TaxID=9261 RepID=UPI0018F792D4|nr:zinc finger and BTB domain-containing protein 22 [Tachyglossus aculeatus]